MRCEKREMIALLADRYSPSIMMTTKVIMMKMATVREFRDQATKLLRSTKPLLITRRGKAAGLYIPLSDTIELPFELRKELQQALARSVRQALEEKGFTEEEILEDFDRFRKRRS